MRCEQTCACGATITVAYTAPRSEYDREHVVERTDALKVLQRWERAHRDCRKPGVRSS